MVNPVHGGPDARGAAQYDFSTNSNACGPCPHTLAAVQQADAMLVDVLAQDFDLIVLPGGMPGAQRLADHQPLAERVQQQARAGLLFAAICAAPALALQGYGVLKQRRMTCYPAFSDRLSGCTFVDQPVVVDGNCITSQGPGTALAFALTLVEQLCGKARRHAVAKGMLLE